MPVSRVTSRSWIVDFGWATAHGAIKMSAAMSDTLQATSKQAGQRVRGRIAVSSILLGTLADLLQQVPVTLLLGIKSDGLLDGFESPCPVLVFDAGDRQHVIVG